MMIEFLNNFIRRTQDLSQLLQALNILRLFFPHFFLAHLQNKPQLKRIPFMSCRGCGTSHTDI